MVYYLSKYAIYMHIYISLCLQYWYDHYLQWNESEYPGVKTLRFSADQVWTPDILLYNRWEQFLACSSCPVHALPLKCHSSAWGHHGLQNSKRWQQENIYGTQVSNDLVRLLMLPKDPGWPKPSFLLLPSANEDFDSTFHTHVLVNSSGYCQWLPPGETS